LRESVQAIIDANSYMTLATADQHGRPWVSPVWFATDDYVELVWVSSPEARHSRNLAVRPEVAIVIFDSRQPPGTGEAVYISAQGGEVSEPDLDRCLDVYSTISQREGLAAWSRSDIEPPARLRLYSATADEHFVLIGTDERRPVVLA